jgi:hypothetical protein
MVIMGEFSIVTIRQAEALFPAESPIDAPIEETAVPALMGMRAVPVCSRPVLSKGAGLFISAPTAGGPTIGNKLAMDGALWERTVSKPSTL